MNVNGKVLFEEGIRIAVEAIETWKGGQTKASLEAAKQKDGFKPGEWLFSRVAFDGDTFLVNYAKIILFNRFLDAGSLMAKATDFDHSILKGEDESHSFFRILVDEALGHFESLLAAEKMAHDEMRRREIHRNNNDSLAQLRKIVADAQPAREAELWFSTEDLIHGLEAEYKSRKEAVEEAMDDGKRGMFRVGF